MARDLLPEQDAEASPTERLARKLLRAMNDPLRWEARHPRAGMHVFRNAQEMATVWAEHGGEPGAVPHVDFEQNMVVAVFEGEGSFKQVRSIAHVIQDEQGLWVLVGRFSRPWSMINPMSLITVPRAEGEPHFLEVETVKAQELLRAIGVAERGA